MPEGTSTPALLITGGRVLLRGSVLEVPVALADGLIVGIGEDAADALPDGPREQLDAAGGLVLPGFQDSHVHPHHAGRNLVQVDLVDAESIDEYLAIVAAYARANPEQAWIAGGGWSMPAFPGGVPTKDLLDRVVPDRPVFLMNSDGHGAWVNSLALELAGITAATTQPSDGRIEVDAEGVPNGCLQEGAADLVGRLVPALSDDELDRGFLAAQERLLAWGVTAWQDAMVETGARGMDNLASYRRIDADGRLIARVVGAHWWERSAGLEQIEQFEAARAELSGMRFTTPSVKIMQDGVAENFTAAMLEPYLDACGCPSGNAGTSFVDPAELRVVAGALSDAGFRVHFHALGDRAVRETLDAIEAVGTMVRPMLAHLQLVHPDDIPRFGSLGAIASIQPLWARHEAQMDDLTIPFLGARRAAWQYPFASLLRAGAVLALGSDWPVSTANPLEILHTAVNRAPAGRTDRPLHGEQALSLAQAIEGYTEGTAFANGTEDRNGRLAIGLDADVVVLDADPFQAPLAEISDRRVAYTIVDGRVVYEAGSRNPSASGRTESRFTRELA